MRGATILLLWLHALVTLCNGLSNQRTPWINSYLLGIMGDKPHRINTTETWVHDQPCTRGPGAGPEHDECLKNTVEVAFVNGALMVVSDFANALTCADTLKCICAVDKTIPDFDENIRGKGGCFRKNLLSGNECYNEVECDAGKGLHCLPHIPKKGEEKKGIPYQVCGSGFSNQASFIMIVLLSLVVVFVTQISDIKL